MPPLIFVTACLAGAMLPWPGSEVIVAGAAALTEGPARLTLIALAAAAQSAGKLVVFGAAAAGARTRAVAGLGTLALRPFIERSGRLGMAVVFLSALASVPPLYATAIVCGATNRRRIPFALAVFAGRVVRYAALVTLIDPLLMGPQ